MFWKKKYIRCAAIDTPDRLDDVVTAAESRVGTDDASIRKLVGSRIRASTEDNRVPH